MPPDGDALGLAWTSLGAAQGFVIALLLVVCVAALDYVTGYEVRLAILYLLPIALSTWTGGPRAGMVIVAAASLCWVVTFRSTHAYSQEIFFYWEGLVMFAVYILFVWLLARLHVALRRADERFLRVLEELHAGVYVIDHDRARIVYANRRLAEHDQQGSPLGECRRSRRTILRCHGYGSRRTGLPLVPAWRSAVRFEGGA